MSMYVVKRGGRRESVHFDKITSRVSKLCYGLDPKVRDINDNHVSVVYEVHTVQVCLIHHPCLSSMSTQSSFLRK